MDKKIFLIAGTQDGRKLAEFLSGKNFDVTASVVSDYGRKLLENCAGIKINDKPLDRDELEKILREENFNFLVDASHPYAKNISANAIDAAQAANIFYVRYERAEIDFAYEKIFHVESYEAAAIKASELGKNIYLTTGSRNLKIFVDLLKDCNLTVRILPTAEVLTQCEALGLTPKQIVAMQGPFSTELNIELFKHAGAEVIVTKNSGQIGGADTKLEAAKILNLPVVMINRPKIFYPNLAKTFDDVLSIIKNFLRKES
ncbi:MAG: cobalt-precorrin-6A reductase [Selenomonadaceae bacterium]|nr:cobalt-precorrin-6A reductase [Selenomonadaceae bacterium]